MYHTIIRTSYWMTDFVANSIFFIGGVNTLASLGILWHWDCPDHSVTHLYIIILYGINTRGRTSILNMVGLRYSKKFARGKIFGIIMPTFGVWTNNSFNIHTIQLIQLKFELLSLLWWSADFAKLLPLTIFITNEWWGYSTTSPTFCATLNMACNW